MHSAKQPSQYSDAVSRPSGTAAASTRVPVRRMPCLLRQPGCTTRAFIKLKRKRHYLGAYDDPAVQELYARLTRVWERTAFSDFPNERTVGGIVDKKRLRFTARTE